jgi:hypothetical protein
VTMPNHAGRSARSPLLEPSESINERERARARHDDAGCQWRGIAEDSYSTAAASTAPLSDLGRLCLDIHCRRRRRLDYHGEGRRAQGGPAQRRPSWAGLLRACTSNPTDANIALRTINPSHLLGGRMNVPGPCGGGSRGLVRSSTSSRPPDHARRRGPRCRCAACAGIGANPGTTQAGHPVCHGTAADRSAGRFRNHPASDVAVEGHDKSLSFSRRAAKPSSPRESIGCRRAAPRARGGHALIPKNDKQPVVQPERTLRPAPHQAARPDRQTAEQSPGDRTQTEPRAP